MTGDAVATEDQLRAVMADHRAAGRRVVFTNGAFDLLHVGHVRMLKEARALGDVLVVGVNDDASVRRNKGAGRPVVPAAERAEVLLALDAVDHVVLFADTTVDRLLEGLRPDVHAKGRDYDVETLPEQATNERLGIEMAFVGDEKAHASRELARQVRSEGPDVVAPIEDADTRGFVLRDRRAALAAADLLDLERLALGKLGTFVEGIEKRFVRRIDLEDGTRLYLKVTRPLERGKRSAIIEFQNHLALRAAGFGAPEPWLAVEGNVDGLSTGALITREAPGEALDVLLAGPLREASAVERLRRAYDLGTTVRALHTARFFSPDLQSWHWFVDGVAGTGSRSLALIDLMRLKRGGREVRRKDAVPGLAALALSVEPFTTSRERMAALRRYLGGTLRHARAWLPAIEKRMDQLRSRGTFRQRAEAAE